VQVRVTGNRAVATEKILPEIRTRAGRPFSAETVEHDVRRLNKTGWFLDIKTSYQRVSGGLVVLFDVLERPHLQYVKYVGNQKIKKKILIRESGLKVGDALDPYAVEEGRRAIEEFYHTHGFTKARVTIVEGTKTGDRGAVFLINEGPKQKILWTHFVGNTIASDRRLLTQIKSKPGILWLFKGEVDMKQIDEDVNRLTAYYRGLGFFRARIGRELSYNEEGDWLTLTFVIDEGPRYTIRNISFLGNEKIPTEKLAEDLKLHAGEFFSQDQLTMDVATIQEEYGSVGYIFADIQADPRFLEQPGQLDLVYNITEGDRYRVGKINVEIKGEYPHTQITTVLNRISLQPGDIVDIRELRASERRLRSSQLFEVSPQTGSVPKIVFSPPEKDEPDAQMARPPSRPPTTRFQSPEPVRRTAYHPWARGGEEPRDRQVDLTLRGQWANQTDGGAP